MNCKRRKREQKVRKRIVARYVGYQERLVSVKRVGNEGLHVVEAVKETDRSGTMSKCREQLHESTGIWELMVMVVAMQFGCNMR